MDGKDESKLLTGMYLFFTWILLLDKSLKVIWHTVSIPSLMTHIYITVHTELWRNRSCSFTIKPRELLLGDKPFLVYAPL